MLMTDQGQAVPSVAAGPPSEVLLGCPYPDLWRRCRRSKLLGPLTADPGEERRAIEVDVIVASRSAWAACKERAEEGWDEIDLDGVILAERTIG
jgi:hypothetical protein